MKNDSELNEKVDQLMKASEYREAVDVLQAELPTVKKSWRLLWNLGWAYFQLERYIQAEPFFKDAVKLSSNEPVCLWALGATLMKIGKLNQAERALRKALDLRESYICRLNLALVYMQQGKLIEAEKVHWKAIELSPNDKERLEAYADFLSDVGRLQEARDLYEQAENPQLGLM